jgi:hypothetical protein
VGLEVLIFVALKGIGSIIESKLNKNVIKYFFKLFFMLYIL